MPNMSYCRFQNTLNDLMDCEEHFDDMVSPQEDKYRQKLFKICKKIVDAYDGAVDELPVEDEDGDE